MEHKIDIISYPGALPPVTNKMLKNNTIIARDYRNRRIGEFLKDLHLTEAKGTGIPTIRKEMIRNGSPSPIFEMDEDKTYFLTTLEIHPESIKVMQEIEILKFCIKPKTRKEIFENKLMLSNQTKNFKRYILPLIINEFLMLSIPEKPKSKLQTYFTTKKGKKYIKKIKN